MMRKARSQRTLSRSRDTHARTPTTRIMVIAVLGVIVAVLFVVRLFYIQVVRHGYYVDLARRQQTEEMIVPATRGEIFMGDAKRSDRYPVAVNRVTYWVQAKPNLIADPAEVARVLAPLLELPYEEVFARLNRPTDPYEPLKRGVSENVFQAIEAHAFTGIYADKTPQRYYPLGESTAHITGFVSSTQDSDSGMTVFTGKYGVEGFFEKQLAGTAGHIVAQTDERNRQIALGDRTVSDPVDGDDIVLTIDKNIQYFVCARLAEAVKRHGADGGSVIVMNTQTGALLSMCSVPSYDPNYFSRVDSVGVYNNPAIFDPYEPGSIFKTITMAIGLDSGSITPASTYDDKGLIKIGPDTVRNAQDKSYGMVTMAEALENSVNTAMVWIADRVGRDTFRSYMESFGFAVPTGISLQTESKGDMSALSRPQPIYLATASFGQGVSVTPIQFITALNAIANGGKLMKPYIVDEVDHPDGTTDRTQPQLVSQVIRPETARMVASMMVSVVEKGHGKRAGVPGYYVAGKTGTAQVADREHGGYLKDSTIGSFAGFAPVENPAFTMLVKIDRPRDVQWAESSAAPLFGEIAEFLLRYLEIPKTR